MTLRTCVVFVVSLWAASLAYAQEWLGFELIDQSALPIVRVSLGGIGEHRLVLDVGFKEVVLDASFVEGSGLEVASRGEEVVIDYYGREEKVPVKYVSRLSLGPAKFQTVRAVLVEGEDGTGIGGLRSYGRIGRDLLEPLRLTVHYPRRLLYLEPSPREEVPAGSVSFQTAGRHLLIPVRLGTEDGLEEATFVLDCGTSGTLVDRKWAAAKGYAPKDATQVLIPRVEVGGFHAENVTVLTGVMKELPYAGEPVGVIGADVLLQLSVSYDFARQLVWLVKVDEESS